MSSPTYDYEQDYPTPQQADTSYSQQGDSEADTSYSSGYSGYDTAGSYSQPADGEGVYGQEARGGRSPLFIWIFGV